MILAVCVGICCDIPIECVASILSMIQIFLEVIKLMDTDFFKTGVGICGVTPKSDSLQKSTAFVATVLTLYALEGVIPSRSASKSSTLVRVLFCCPCIQ